MKTKNEICECGHQIIQKTALNGSGLKYWEHLPKPRPANLSFVDILIGVLDHNFSCDCKSAKPKNQSEIIKTKEVKKIL